MNILKLIVVTHLVDISLGKLVNVNKIEFAIFIACKQEKILKNCNPALTQEMSIVLSFCSPPLSILQQEENMIT